MQSGHLASQVSTRNRDKGETFYIGSCYVLTDAARYSSFGWVQTVQTCSDRSDMILERLERFGGLSHLAITDAQLRLHLSSPVHVDLPDLRWVKAIHKNHKNHKNQKNHKNHNNIEGLFILFKLLAPRPTDL